MSLKELGKFLLFRDWPRDDIRAMKKSDRVKAVARILAEENDDWKEK